MLPFDDDDGGDFDIGETTQAERDLAPDSPSKDLEEKYAEPDESELIGDVGDVDEDTFTAFVASAVLTNIGVFAVSLGLMLWYFRGMLQVGGGLIVIGFLALLRTYQYYYEWKQSREEDEEDEGPDRITAPADDEGDEGDETGDAGDTTTVDDATEADSPQP
ncbi:MAG: hypothetical protein ABEH81_10130 [Halopenitus sp.]